MPESTDEQLILKRSVRSVLKKLAVHYITLHEFVAEILNEHRKLSRRREEDGKMAVVAGEFSSGGGGGSRDEIRTQFITREGTYKLMTLSEYSRPTRMPLNGPNNTPVRVSFVKTLDPATASNDDRLCFNVGKELYVYPYNGIRKAADLTRPVDKRLYRGTSPTCHDFNSTTATSDRIYLVVGFSAGQVQLLDPIGKENSKLFNEERLIDRSKVTCIRWLPGVTNQFLASHASGQLYVYSEELSCGTAPPVYQLFKEGDGFSVYTCKTKSTRNPLYRWLIDGAPCINEFAFSPCSRYLAVVSQDGFLRVFNYNCIELLSLMKSYFGGLLCVCWSPDGKYLITGGEDDLVTVFSFVEKRVVCRGRGHTSWVNVVAFDPYTTIVTDGEAFDMSGSDEDLPATSSPPSLNHGLRDQDTTSNLRPVSLRSSTKNLTDSGSGGESGVTSYRFGSVGQDTMMCLWDLTEEILRPPVVRHRTSTMTNESSQSAASVGVVVANNTVANHCEDDNCTQQTVSSTLSSSSSSSLNTKLGTLSLNEDSSKDSKSKKKNKDSKSSVNKLSINTSTKDSDRISVAVVSPCLNEVPVIEPLTCKRIAHERLTSLIFREDCFVTSCQEGIVYTWARPSRALNGGFC